MERTIAWQTKTFWAPLVLSPALTERRSISEHIAISLRDAIRSGALADGTELNQMSLAAHYGVSRVPVREAMLQLQAEGWMTSRLHQRAVVRGISSDRIAEMLEIRTTLECSLIERAIPTMTEPTLILDSKICAVPWKKALSTAPGLRQTPSFTGCSMRARIGRRPSSCSSSCSPKSNGTYGHTVAIFPASAMP